MPLPAEQHDNSADIHHAALVGDVAAVSKIIELGAQINAFDEIGYTPLLYAARNEHLEVVKLLIQAGVQIDAHDESRIGNTALGEIAGFCSYEMAKILIQAGANPTIRGWMQLSAIDRAKERTDANREPILRLLHDAAKKFPRVA